ncbi:MAG: nitrile hydratase subunit alpha [Alphaproteobacteria bacterium]|nr:nitrile hydratase subunit alpha [Alphaproteobacteria bacterium]
MSHDHSHDHDPLEKGTALRVRALEELLVAKGLVTSEALDTVISHYENNVGPRNGASVVAKAWVDADFKARLLADGPATLEALGFKGFQGEHMRVIENTPDVHNMVVCTLCSCYPWPLLGLPPAWFKSMSYRARAVSEPRAVLADFGVAVPADTSVRVWDSTAEVRYLVMPMRPAGTDVLNEADLAALVTRDGMIGTALV